MMSRSLRVSLFAALIGFTFTARLAIADEVGDYGITITVKPDPATDNDEISVSGTATRPTNGTEIAPIQVDIKQNGIVISGGSHAATVTGSDPWSYSANCGKLQAGTYTVTVTAFHSGNNLLKSDDRQLNVAGHQQPPSPP